MNRERAINNIASFANLKHTDDHQSDCSTQQRFSDFSSTHNDFQRSQHFENNNNSTQPSERLPKTAVTHQLSQTQINNPQKDATNQNSSLNTENIQITKQPRKQNIRTHSKPITSQSLQSSPNKKWTVLEEQALIQGYRQFRRQHAVYRLIKRHPTYGPALKDKTRSQCRRKIWYIKRRQRNCLI